MSEVIILKKNPKIEFRLRNDGFDLIDDRTHENTGMYYYADLQSIELNHAWFPKVSQYFRAITWVLNGVPYFPDADSYKKASLIFHFKQKKLGIWLTDTYMADQAKRVKVLLADKYPLID